MKSAMMKSSKAVGVKKTAMKAVASGKKPATKLTSKALAAGKNKPLTLDEKLKKWKEDGDMESPLGLDHVEQKQLSSKFLNALKGAPSVVSQAYSKLSQEPEGQKNKNKQLLVKSWIMDKQWGDTFIEHTKSLTYNQENKQVEKLETLKQLEQKYSEDEISDLLQSGGIAEVRHNKSNRVKLYIDHGIWERSKSLNKTRAVSSKSTKQEDEEDALEGFETGFNSFSMDLEKAEDFFLQECTNTKGGPDTLLPTMTGKKQKPSALEALDDEDVGKALKMVMQASNLLNNRLMLFEATIEGLKKNTHYEKGLKKTSIALISRMTDLQEKCKFYGVKGGSMQMMKAHLQQVSECLKEVAGHTQLLKRL